jgi:hypothetical protein
MKFNLIAAALIGAAGAVPSVEKRAAGFAQGQPISADGKGGPLLGMYHDILTLLY